MPLGPDPLATLFTDLWHDARAVRNSTAGAVVIEILARGPPQGWRAVPYRLTTRRGGKPVWAWIPQEADPRTAIAAALGVPHERLGTARLALEDFSPDRVSIAEIKRERCAEPAPA